MVALINNAAQTTEAYPIIIYIKLVLDPTSFESTVFFLNLYQLHLFAFQNTQHVPG